jgi:hypothetical protein
LLGSGSKRGMMRMLPRSGGVTQRKVLTTGAREELLLQGVGRMMRLDTEWRGGAKVPRL